MKRVPKYVAVVFVLLVCLSSGFAYATEAAMALSSSSIAKFDITGVWVNTVTPDDNGSEFYQDGDLVYGVYSSMAAEIGWGHYMTGRYVTQTRIIGIEYRKQPDGCRNTLQFTWTVTSANAATETWRALNGSSCMAAGTTGTDYLIRK